MNILITGTGKGLGGALAALYLEKGDTVYGISRRRNELLDKHPGFHFLSQDLSLFDQMRQTIPGFLEKTTSLDIVILNAGIISMIKDMKDCTLEEIKNVMDINVWANKIIIDLLFTYISRVDQVVAVSSGAAVYGNRGWNGYSISKAALNMLIRLYAAEEPGTHFCSIAPGLIDTGMQEYISSLPDDNRFSSVSKLKETRRSGRMPTPEEAAIIFTAAVKKASGYPSGSFLDVRDMDPGSD